MLVLDSGSGGEKPIVEYSGVGIETMTFLQGYRAPFAVSMTVTGASSCAILVTGLLRINVPGFKDAAKRFETSCVPELGSLAETMRLTET